MVHCRLHVNLLCVGYFCFPWCKQQVEVNNDFNMELLKDTDSYLKFLDFLTLVSISFGLE